MSILRQLASKDNTISSVRVLRALLYKLAYIPDEGGADEALALISSGKMTDKEIINALMLSYLTLAIHSYLCQEEPTDKQIPYMDAICEVNSNMESLAILIGLDEGLGRTANEEEIITRVEDAVPYTGMGIWIGKSSDKPTAEDIEMFELAKEEHGLV